MEQRLGSSSIDILPTPIPGGRALTTEDRQSVDLSSDIKGWGSDLDPALRPGVPRDKAPEIGAESLYVDIPQQEPPFTIHKSTEHARLTPVFGTSCPPTGLSGRMRDAAYRYSEGRFAHWLMLMAADRVNVMEALVSDLAQLRVPNLVKEMGLASEWKYNRAGVIRKAAIAGVLLAAMIAYSRSRRRGVESS
jgi:hypothetical protein